MVKTKNVKKKKIELTGAAGSALSLLVAALNSPSTTFSSLFRASSLAGSSLGSVASDIFGRVERVFVCRIESDADNRCCARKDEVNSGVAFSGGRWERY